MQSLPLSLQNLFSDFQYVHSVSEHFIARLPAAKRYPYPLTPQSLATTNLLSVLMCLSLLTFLINGVTQEWSFVSLSLVIMFKVHHLVVVCILFKTVIYRCIFRTYFNYMNIPHYKFIS